MCDYSLHSVKSRPARVSDKLTTRSAIEQTTQSNKHQTNKLFWRSISVIIWSHSQLKCQDKSEKQKGPPIGPFYLTNVLHKTEHADGNNRLRKGEYGRAKPPITNGSVASRRLWEGL